jgi:ribosome maturation protein SDO1
MANTIARIKKAGKNFEIIVDMDNALKFKKGESSYIESEAEMVFTDAKKGNSAPSADLKAAFGTTDVNQIAAIIVKNGEVMVSQEHRDEERDKRYKQIVDFLSRNAFDPRTGKPHTPQRIESALEQAHVNIKNGPIDSQIPEIIEQISKIIPIKVETKRIRITIPAIYTGKAYGVINQYKENENWLNDGSLEVVVKIPSGVIMDFYDKLNGITHGSALTEEIKED